MRKGIYHSGGNAPSAPLPEQNHPGEIDNLQACRIDIHRFSRSGEYLSGLPELPFS